MKLEEIQTIWEQDCNIDKTELGNESTKIPQLHSKYYKIYSQERLKLKGMQSEQKRLYKIKHEYYTGTLSEEELKEYDWDPCSLRILKNDLSTYMEADKDLNQDRWKIDIQQEKVDFVESIIKSLTNRGFQIRAAIDWVKFTNGV